MPLVIVESPAKCKKIETYLGSGYKCVASFGHLRELVSLEDIDRDFQCKYTSIKLKQIEVLRKAIQGTDEVILATDDDREGEAIAWHICQIFHLNLEKTKRIIFHEITAPALQDAILHPKKINLNIVHAQQARQILDMLVGFRVSPILWKYMDQCEKSLSAGRCQTPALKLIYDNYLDIQRAQEKKVYNTTGYFTNLHLPFDLNKQYETSEDMLEFLKESCNFNHVYSINDPVKIFKKSPEPFTTARLQQTASNELYFSPKETMKICQTLYECGYITYMRTDSNIYSDEFMNSVNQYILKKYDVSYYGYISNKNDSAHEAIRPTNISLETIDASEKEKKMYKLIWENTLESCMTSASFFTLKAEISACKRVKYSYTAEQIIFPGWLIVKNVVKESKEYAYLQTIKPNIIMPYKKIISRLTMNTKSHYSEARLIQLLEEKGIGRPSTFAMLIDKIQERGYVKKENVQGKEIICKDYELVKEVVEIEKKREFGKEKNKLVIKPLGIKIVDFLEKHFHDLFNYEYTKEMEDILDKISQGLERKDDLCKKCDTQINQLIEKISISQKIAIEESKNIEKYRINESENKPINDMVILEGSIPESNRVNECNPKEIILGNYENELVILKKGRYGIFVTWGENSKTLKELGNRPLENITLEEVEPLLKTTIREISNSITIRKSKNGDYIFYKTPKMKKPKFFKLEGFRPDYRTCELEIILDWIRKTYQI